MWELFCGSEVEGERGNTGVTHPSLLWSGPQEITRGIQGLMVEAFRQGECEMRSSALAIRQTGANFANNIMTLITFLVLNLIVLIPIAQLFLRALE